MEVHLDESCKKEYSQQSIYIKSGTRKEDLLLSPERIRSGIYHKKNYVQRWEISDNVTEKLINLLV